jgi:hypothetical protein
MEKCYNCGVELNDENNSEDYYVVLGNGVDVEAICDACHDAQE